MAAGDATKGTCRAFHAEGFARLAALASGAPAPVGELAIPKNAHIS